MCPGCDLSLDTLRRAGLLSIAIARMFLKGHLADWAFWVIKTPEAWHTKHPKESIACTCKALNHCLLPFPIFPSYTPSISSFDHKHQDSHYLKASIPFLASFNVTTAVMVTTKQVLISSAMRPKLKTNKKALAESKLYLKASC